MRYASLAILLSTGTLLSGCAASQLASIAGSSTPAVQNLNYNCTVDPTNINCAGPNGTGTPAVVPPGTVVLPNTGNTSNAATGDVTLAIESTKLKSTSAIKAVSTLTETTNPNKATLKISTNLSTNSSWPQTHTMDEDLYGTCRTQGGIDPANQTQCLAPNTAGSLGATYHEYRFKDASIPADEELQVWHWNSSYGTQYRDNATGDIAAHQAFSFGGNYTTAANIPTAGQAQYQGKYTATGDSSGWVDSVGVGQDISHNNHWQIVGDTDLTADFSTGAFTGALTPKSWVGLAADGTLQDAITHDPNKFILVGGVPTLNPNYIGYNVNTAGFMNDKTILSGTITKSATDLLHPNSVTGKAALDTTQGWYNDANSPLYAGFFGGSAKEVTGVFAVDGTYSGPRGGSSAHNYYRVGKLSMQGVFNGQCVSAVGTGASLICP